MNFKPSNFHISIIDLFSTETAYQYIIFSEELNSKKESSPKLKIHL